MPSPFVQPPPVTNPRDFTQGAFNGVTFNGGAVVYNPPPEHLVSGQLRQLQSEDNPLVRAARERAIRLANARGSIDGSYSAGAAARATIDSMLPVAQQDSATLTNVQMNNLSNIQNAQQSERDRQQMLSANLASGYQAAQDRAMQQQELDQRLQMQREGLAFQGEQAGYGREHDVRMGDLGFGWDIGRAGFGLEADLARGEQDIYGRRQIQSDGYNQDIGRLDQQFNNASRLSYQDYQQANQQFLQVAQRDMWQSFLNNPDLLRNPEAMNGIMEFFLGGVQGTYSANYWDGVFGG